MRRDDEQTGIIERSGRFLATSDGRLAFLSILMYAVAIIGGAAWAIHSHGLTGWLLGEGRIALILLGSVNAFAPVGIFVLFIALCVVLVGIGWLLCAPFRLLGWLRARMTHTRSED